MLKKLKQIPYSLICVIMIVTFLGVLMLYSAAGHSWDPWAYKQLIRILLGLGLMLVFALTDLRAWITYAYSLYFISLVLLIAVEFMGKIGMGAQRWIDLYVITLQPSEIMKITLLLALARYFHLTPLEEVTRFRGLLLPFLMVALPCTLVLRQPDLGTMLILAGASFSIFFTAGLRMWKIMSALGLCLISFPIIWNKLHGYQQQRILTFLNPENDPLGAGYHILQSKIALGSGSFFGKGWGQGSQSHLNFLPEKQTDFIFSMYCEEFGILGGLILLFLYLVILSYGFWVTLRSRTPFGRYLAVGLNTLFFLYVFVNTSMGMGLVPVVGVPLPLVSYGGTAMMTLLMGLGLLISVEIHRDQRIGRNP
jgi:rod shape determining protein RodA